MATEILLNDGGAPARILPFTAAAACTAGHLVTVTAADSVTMSTSGTSGGMGFMFVDAPSGQNGSVITGKGVILNVAVTGTTAAGNLLSAGSGATATGFLHPIGALTDTAYAIALEVVAGGDTGAYCKVITI